MQRNRTLIACFTAAFLAVVLLSAGMAHAHEISFNSTVTYSSTQPAGGVNSIANWTGAVFDAANIGGSGVNADGGADNGIANDSFTYVANNQPVQGQTFTTGSAANGYQLNAITVQMAGYTNNLATGSNQVTWNLHEQNGPVILTVCRIDGTERKVLTMQNFKAGDVGNPGSGSSANGPGAFITFHLPFTTYLDPDTTYGFELRIGNGSSNYFEWLGTSTDPYTEGTAYHHSGSTVTPLSGDRVFMADMTALPVPPAGFAHPGTLHTQADLDRMKAKIAANEEPWLSGYNMLLSSPYNNLGWPAYDVDYIVRGPSGSNYTRSQQDAQLIYTLTLIWHLTGNTAYADRAVYIANVWSDLLGVTGDSNLSLAAGICGYLFAISGDLLSPYPGWAEADKQAYKDMMMRVFYPANFDFLWRHHDTFWRTGGNTHYRLNWDTANMASMAAIGVLCDNRAVYEQAVDYFKYGPGNGRVERAAWYLFPEGLSQSEESGRDQGHNLGGWHAMALLCQTAWNQGDDLFSYDNNRVLRAFEYNAKYNLGNDVPWTYHRNSDLSYTETLSSHVRGLGGYYQYELVYNHYANVMGIEAPWSKLAADATRPEPWPNTGIHPSQVDWFGLGTLTYSQDPITTDQAPTGLHGNWSKNKVILYWWGSARATSYRVKRAVSVGGPYTQIGTPGGPDMNFTDTNVDNGTTYYYIVTAVTPSGNLDSDPLRVAQELVTHYTFEGTANDIAGDKDAVLHGGSTGLPNYTTGFGGGQAINLDGVDDYVQLPVGAGNYQDITIAAWVNWDGGGNWQRVFDFGSEMEKCMFLTPSNGGTMRFEITTSRGNEGSGRLDGPIMPTGQWTHVTVSLNGDTGTLYVNGKPVDAALIDQVDPLFGQPYCYIGKSMWTPDPLFNGRVDDFRIYNFALSGDEVWDLWGQSANHAPVFDTDPIDKSVDEDTLFSDTLMTHASDADGNPLTFSKVTGPAWMTVALNGMLSGTPDNGDVGENVFVVRVTDSIGAADDAVLRVNVINVNDAPVWSENPITGASTKSGVAYAGTIAPMASDSDVGDVLTFSKIDGPDWLKVASDGTLSGVPTLMDAGDNTFTVRVMDSQGIYADAALLIHVDANPTLAWWRFEEGAAGTEVPGTSGWTTYQVGTPDISGNGNHLCDFWDGPNDSGITYSANIPAVGDGSNTVSGLSEGGNWPSMFTWSGQSAPAGVDLETAVLSAWTIEAFIYPTAISGSNRGIVGRDGKRSSTDVASPLYFNIQGNGTLRCTYYDQAAIIHDAQSSVTLSTHRWYYVAATCDGTTLKLWLADLTAGETTATQVASANVSGSGDSDFGPWPDNGRGNWSVFRQYWNSGDVDRFVGNIDEVRISAAALDVNVSGLLNAFNSYDINSDGRVDINDLDILATWWLWSTDDCGTNAECLNADIDENGQINLSDFAVLAGHWLE